MSDEITFDRITFDKGIMSGQACIRGMRIPASVIVNLVAQGQSNEEIIIDYPVITNEDIKQCLEYAAWILSREYVYSF